MKRLAMPFLLACLSVFLSVPGCASIYDDCLKPEAGKITWTGTATELGEMVVIALQCDPSLDPAVAPVCAIEELNNLEATLGPDGKATINCIIAKIEGNPSAAAALKSRAHAVGVKRGVNQSMICPDAVQTIASVYKKESPSGSAPRAPEGRAFSYSGETPSASLSRCNRECGDNVDVIAPPAGCRCYRKVGSTWAWVAAR